MSQTTPDLLPSTQQSSTVCPTTCHNLSRFPHASDTEPEVGHLSERLSRRLNDATSFQCPPKRVRLHSREQDEHDSILSMCRDGQSCHHDLLRVVPSRCVAHTLEQHCRIISEGLGVNDEQDATSPIGSIARWLSAVIGNQKAQQECNSLVENPFLGEPISEPPIVWLNDRLKYSPGVMVSAMIYLQRLVDKQPHIQFNSRTAHRLVITAIAVSAKFHDDLHWHNRHHAIVGAIDVAVLNRLEKFFLQLMDCDLKATQKLEPSVNLPGIDVAQDEVSRTRGPGVDVVLYFYIRSYVSFRIPF